MLVKAMAMVTQLRFDQEYGGTIEVVIPEVEITRIFDLKLTDPAGENLRYEVTHQARPFFALQAGGPDGDFVRQIKALPRGRQMLASLFIDLVNRGYEIARSIWANPHDRAQQEMLNRSLEAFGGSFTCHGQAETKANFQLADEFNLICDELRALPETSERPA